MESLIAFDRVDFGYPSGPPVLSEVSFALYAGELVGLIGPNGAGKTTMLELALGAIRPNSGSLQVMGKAPWQGSPIERARRIAYLPQAQERFHHSTVYDVVASGRRPYRYGGRFSEEDERFSIAAAQRLGIERWLDRRADNLSGGERQRALLARIVAQDTPIVLCDEPAASLDPKYRTETFRLLRSLAADNGKGVLASVHDLGLAAEYCDRLVLISGRRIAFDGDPSRLSEELLSEAYDVRVSIGRTEAGLYFHYA